MPEEKSGRFSGFLIMGLAAASVVVALVFAFGRGEDQQDATDSDTPSSANSASEEVVNSERPRDFVVPTDSGGEASLDAPVQPPTDPPYRMPPMERMPDRVAEDFARGMDPIPEEILKEMQAGMHEPPPHIRAEMENAGSRTIPPEILKAFQNPFPEISEEDLEMLRQNGLNPRIQ